MPRKKRRGNDCIQELERQLNKSLKQKDENTACDTYVELGEEYRRIGDLHEALSYYRKGADLAGKLKSYENAAFAHRALAEILVDPSFGENARALQHGKKYLEAANKSGKIHFIQLAYHVLGWLHLQIYLNSDAKQAILLEKGKQWCERSLTYLSKHAADIDCDKDAVQMGEDSRSRKARLQQVLSQICDKMNLQSLSLRYHSAAMAYATRAGDHDLQYRCLLSKLNFSGDQRLKTAIELAHVAASLDQQAHSEAKFILAQEKIRAKDFVGAKWDLISMLASKEHEKLDSDERKSFYQILITVYKTLERLRVLPSADEHLKMKISEKVADSLYEVGFSEISLEFYKQMLNYATRKEDKIKALVSIAETAKELDRYHEALDCFIEVENLENTLDISDTKKADTAICIYVVAANVDSLPEEKVLEYFRKAEQLAVRNSQKKTLYENMLDYAKKNDAGGELLVELEAKLKYVDGDAVGDDDRSGSEERNEADFVDKWDQLTDTQIVTRCHEEANRQSMEERIRSEKDKKINLYGETRMHEAARGNDTQYLKMLIKMGYSVNARDEGGWTPLHEAVGALKLENVRILAENGADLNLRSNEGTLSADGERTDSGGLTPLMEACDRGATAIANLLLHCGANVTVKNRDDWTALDFLRNAMKVGMIEHEDMADAKRLISMMEKKLKDAHVTVNAEPPPKKLKLENKLKPKTYSGNAAQNLDPNIANLHEYRKTMNVVGRGAIHDRTNALLDVLGDDDNDGLFDEDEDDCSISRKQLEPPLDDILVGIDDLAQHSSTTSTSASPSSRPLSSSRRQYSRAEIEENTDLVHSGMPKDDANFDDEMPGTSGFGVSVEPKRIPPAVSKRRENRNRVHFERDSSDDEPIQLSSRSVTQNMQNANRERDFFRECNRNSVTDGANVRGTEIRLLQSQNVPEMRLLPSQNVQTMSSQSASTRDAATISSSAKSSQIFLKIIIKRDDGTRYKMKGMPFASTATIGDVRKRCEQEVKNDAQYTSMLLCHDDCELSDDTPIELIVAEGNKILECIVIGWSEPSASLIYTRRAKRVMENVVRAFDGSVSSSCLDLREMNIGEDDAICAAMETLKTNLLELLLDGNSLSASFVDAITGIMPHLTVLSVPCCGLESRSLRQLIVGSSPWDKLNKLDMSFNNFNEIGCGLLGTVVSLCPKLVQLKLALCNISQSTADDLVEHIVGMTSLVELDLSFNRAINSEHAIRIIGTLNTLKNLDLSCTGVTELGNLPEEKRNLEVLNLSLNHIHNPDDIVQWSLTYCPRMTLLDLSATPVDSTIIELCLKLKANKAPLTTILIADCDVFEADVEKVVDSLKSFVNTNSTVRFQFSRKFRGEIEQLLPESYRFCIK